MSLKKLFGLLFTVSMFGLLAFGADLSGKWSGQTADNHDVVLTLKSSPDLSGTLQSVDGKTQYPLQDLKMDGEVISFSVDVEYEGNTIRVVGKGKTAADQIQLHLETADGSWSSEAALTRQQAK